jgi:hypothetical protein
MPQVAKKEVVSPSTQIARTDTPTGQNTPISGTPQAVSAKTEVPKLSPVKPLTQPQVSVKSNVPAESSESASRTADVANEMQTIFDDAIETKIMNLQEKNITDPAQIAKAVGGMLRSIKIDPPENSHMDVKSFYALQKDIKNNASTKYGIRVVSKGDNENVFWSKERSSGIADKEEAPAKRKEAPDRTLEEQEAMDAEKKAFNAAKAQKSGEQTIKMINNLAEKAEKKVSEGKNLGTWDGFALYLKEVMPKIYSDEKYAKSFFGWNFVKNMMKDQVDSVGNPKSQSVDLINFMIAHERKTGLPPKPSDYKNVLSKVQKERHSDSDVSKMDESKQDSSGIQAENGFISKSDLKGMKIKDVRQKDEAYDWMTEAEFNMPEIAANFRKGTENPIDGFSAANKLARQMIKNQVSFFARIGIDSKKVYPDLNKIQVELMKKYNIKPAGETKKVIEEANKQKEAADVALTKSIRDWQKKNGDTNLSSDEMATDRAAANKQKVDDALQEILDAIMNRSSSK